MEIRTLNPGEKITEPGFYSMPLDQHHNQPCDGPSVTSGVLRTMTLQTPADVWAFSLLNPDRWEKPTTDALRLGQAMACYVEGGEDELARHFARLPQTKPNKPTAAQLAAIDEGRGTEAGLKSKAFWDMIDADPRDYITDAQWEMLCNMGKALALDPAASAALGGVPEITMAWQDEQTDLWCLARPDQVSFSGMLSDYKKVNTAARPFNFRYCDRRITDYAYDSQMGFAAEAFEMLTGEWPDQVGLVFQWDYPPYHVILREISEEDLRIGMWRNRVALGRFRECLDSGHWPGPGEDVGAYQRPDWQRDMLLEQMNINGVAP